jgi:hypothetical protein
MFRWKYDGALIEDSKKEGTKKSYSKYLGKGKNVRKSLYIKYLIYIKNYVHINQFIRVPKGNLKYIEVPII